MVKNNRSNSTKYFVFNKEMDFNRGSRANIRVTENDGQVGIELKDSDYGRGTFISRLLDSQEKATEWHRMVVNGYTISEASVRFTFFVSETNEIRYKGNIRRIDDFIQDKSVKQLDKIEAFKEFKVAEFNDPKDILLHKIKGRYLWFVITLVAQGNLTPRINKIKIYFPKNSWVKYLPDIYQSDGGSSSFVERYLGMFQSLYQDVTDEIDNISEFFDPDSVKGEFVEWLGSWLAVEDSFIWNEEQLRFLVKNGINLFNIRGTIDYVKTMVWLYTGKEPYVVEYHNIVPYMRDGDTMDRITALYSDSNYVFTIVVDIEKQISNKEFQILTRIINHAKPAHVGCNIIVLERYIFLDKHSYLGINSVLGNYNAFRLDGQSSIPFTTITMDE